MFMGLNPGREEALRGLPFVGKSGRFLRRCMDAAGIDSWAIVNSILCSTNNEREIPDPQLCRSLCRPNVAIFVRAIMPKVIVPCGNGAGAVFGLEKGITGNARKVFISRGPAGRAIPTLVMPLVHPSSLIRNGGTSAAAYPDFMDRLKSILEISQKFDPEARDYNLPIKPEPLFNNIVKPGSDSPSS